MENENKLVIDTEEIPMPKACANCSVEPVCDLNGFYLQCHAGQAFFEYMEKFLKAYGEGANRKKTDL